jgi:hypothetical protein
MSQSRYAIDLTRNQFVRASGDLVCVGTWMFNPDQQDYEPCLVIVPRYRKSGFKPCCVALSAAYKYDSPQYLARASSIFLGMLGMEDCMSNANKVAELIHSHLGDLIRMRPNPTQAIVVADASVMIDGVKRSMEVLDYQPLAQA